MKVFNLLLSGLLVVHIAIGYLPIASVASTQATKVNRVLGDDLTAFINSDYHIRLSDKNQRTGQTKEILSGIVVNGLAHKSGIVLMKCFLTGGEKLSVLSRGKSEAKTIIRIKDGTTISGKVIACTAKTLTLSLDAGAQREILWSDVSRVNSPYFCTISGIGIRTKENALTFEVKTLLTGDSCLYKSHDVKIADTKSPPPAPGLNLLSPPPGVFGAVFDLAPNSGLTPPATPVWDPRALGGSNTSTKPAYMDQAYVFRMQMPVPQQLAFAVIPQGKEPVASPSAILMWSTTSTANVTNQSESVDSNQQDAGRHPDDPPPISCDSEATRFQITSPPPPKDAVPPPPMPTPPVPEDLSPMPIKGPSPPASTLQYRKTNS